MSTSTPLKSSVRMSSFRAMYGGRPVRTADLAARGVVGRAIVAVDEERQTRRMKRRHREDEEPGQHQYLAVNDASSTASPGYRLINNFGSASFFGTSFCVRPIGCRCHRDRRRSRRSWCASRGTGLALPRARTRCTTGCLPIELDDLGLPEVGHPDLVPARDDVERQLEPLPGGDRRSSISPPAPLGTVAPDGHRDPRRRPCRRARGHPVHGHDLAGAGPFVPNSLRSLPCASSTTTRVFIESVGDQHPPSGEERHVLRPFEMRVVVAG